MLGLVGRTSIASRTRTSFHHLTLVLRITPQARHVARTSRGATGPDHLLRCSMASHMQILDLEAPPRNSLEHMSGFQNTLPFGAATSVQSLFQPRREKGVLLDRYGLRPSKRDQRFIPATHALHFRAIRPDPPCQTRVRQNARVSFYFPGRSPRL